MERLTFTNGTIIEWEHGLDGGGSTQFQDILDILLPYKKVYKRGLEWCAGLGAIGFSILDANLCEHMTFMDKYEPFKECIESSAIKNNLTDKVKTICTDAIFKLPENMKFELVVANPPHCYENFLNSFNDPHLPRLLYDEKWKIHKEFFANIKNYLIPESDIFLSQVNEHAEHIQLAIDNGFKYQGSYPAKVLGTQSQTPAVVMHYKYEEKVY